MGLVVLGETETETLDGVETSGVSAAEKVSGEWQ